MTETDSKTSETSTGEVAPVESKPAPATEPETETANETPSGSVTVSASDPVETGSETETHSGTADTLAGDVAAPEESAETLSGAPAPGKKKRRRRRQKTGAQAGPSDAPEAKSGHHHAPFLHLFAGGVARKHAFSVGEEIAGRVERVEHGAVLIDVFGKATAVADVDEPREIPAIAHEEPEAPPSIAPEPGEASASSEGAEATSESEIDPAEDTTVPAAEAVTLSESERPSWEGSPSESSDVHDDLELGEADTVVSAKAFDPSASSDVQLAATEPPEAGAPAAEAATPTEEAAPNAAAASGWMPAPPPVEDLADADLTLLEPLPELEPPQAGAIFRGRIGAVAESGHIAIVNRIVDKPAVRKALRAAREQHLRVHGVVYGYNRGGFDVLVAGVRAFCPASAMSLTPIEDPNVLVGQRCEFSLPQDKGGKRSIIVSRRNILEKEARKRARQRMTELEVGAKLKGKVLDVRDYGVLVDLGDGLDGLVHLSEVSWSRGVRPHDAAKVGDEVDVEVVKIQPATRKDRYGRVSLSMRACQPDPWDAAKDTLRPGIPVKGKVVRTTDFGAFVQLQENIEGLLHISELGGSKELTHAKQAVTEGDDIHVVVERVDRDQRRISLSKLSETDAKAIEAGEIEVGKAPRSVKPGTHLQVIVKRIEHSGAQVQVDGMLGKRGRGFIPNRELQDVRDDKRRGVSQGDVIEVKVIGTERDGTLRCSVRARLLDEERKAVREYRKESAKEGLGTFGDLLKAKLGGGDKPE